jgi:uncharacterized RDD family membrane protein YckC
MNWYYVSNGQQAGPVDDAQLAELVRNGSVLFDTLIWREGMDNWLPYGQVHVPSPPPLMAPPPQAIPPAQYIPPAAVVCSECGGTFSPDQVIRYENRFVCAACKPAFVQKLAEGAQLKNNSGTLAYAGFWIRVGAKLLDGLILSVFIIPFVIYFVFTGVAAGASNRPSDALAVVQLLVQLGYLALNAVYSIFFVGKYGATPGKMACGLRIVAADGSKISYLRATGRFFAEMLSGIICYIGYIIVGFDQPEKRALHDHICNTRVIYK